MKILLLFLSCMLAGRLSEAQLVRNDSLYSVAHLREDLAYLKKQVYEVHAYPYTELNNEQYDQLFEHVAAQLDKPLNATQFLRLMKPLIAHLADEHAYIGIPQSRLSILLSTQPIFLPFTLEKQDNQYVIGDVFGPAQGIVKGQVISAIDNEPIATWIKRCTDLVSGYPEQREAAVLRRFGYLFGWANMEEQEAYTLSLKGRQSLQFHGVDIDAWNVYLDSKVAKSNCEERISYRQVGHTGYLNACSFDVKKSGAYSMNYFVTRIDSIFKLIRETGIKSLVIDVSNNEGGNSAVGDYLIAYFNKKPYKGYQSTWKRSEEYRKLYESWGIKNDFYEHIPVGNSISYEPATVTPGEVLYPFEGKVVILVGQHTFSSAILFATLVKDNQLALVAGQVPVNGHPNHFGEMYNTKLPNTKIELRFGVKEWIRPAGKATKDGNQLLPNLLLNDKEMADVKELIRKAKL